MYGYFSSLTPSSWDSPLIFLRVYSFFNVVIILKKILINKRRKLNVKLRPVSSTILIGAAAGIMLTSKENRNKIHNLSEKLKYKWKSFRSNELSNKLPIKKGGNPDPMNVEDNKMVSEGALTSVTYYNAKEQ